MERRTRQRTTPWTQVGEVVSDSNPNTVYKIKRHNSSGRMGCDCVAFRYAPKDGKTCKHLQAWGRHDLRISGEAVSVEKGETIIVQALARADGIVEIGGQPVILEHKITERPALRRIRIR